MDHKTHSSFYLLFRLYSYLSTRRRVQIILLTLVMIFSSLSELVSLGAVLPFLSALTNQNPGASNSSLKFLSFSFNTDSPLQYALWSTIIFVASIIIASLIRLLNIWLNGLLSALIGSELSCLVYMRTLYQPYSLHISRNTSDIITSISTEISQVVGALNIFLQFSSACFVSFGLIVGLFFINPAIALTTSIVFGFAYLLLAYFSRSKLNRNGQMISVYYRQQLKALQEGLGAIRDVLLDGTQRAYIDIYSRADRPLRLLGSQNTFISSSPRFILESVGIASLALLGYLLTTGPSGVSYGVIPSLGAFAIGSQRLLPSLQQVYSNWASLNGNNAALVNVLSLIQEPFAPPSDNPPPLTPILEIKCSNISFSYSHSTPLVLRNINLHINVGECIGIIGTTGSGKSTFADIFMGLLQPTQGHLYVDNVQITSSVSNTLQRSWQSSIAHVPQSIFLTDSTFIENIAFGVPSDEVDQDRVAEAAKRAQIFDFIQSLPKGLHTSVGERGMRLSGGQRQRIGIARALYKNASILVLDEATSALDQHTEYLLMQALHSFKSNLTVLMIAHRLSTLKNCDRILQFSNGSIVADGPPGSILNKVSQEPP